MKFKSKNDSDFFSELIKKVDVYMETKGGNRFADKSIYIKGIILIGLYLSSYILLLSRSLNIASSILLVMIMGLAGVMIVFNIVHDASHNVLFKKGH
ncbi:MAG: hypothetical protein E6H08_04620 [Bacteroidetes bacterium]|nr:MAG: hypothetical protein E6H08_04620 [Bacteroidota bacterium]